MLRSILQPLLVAVCMVACVSADAKRAVEHPRQRESTIRHAVDREAKANPAHPWMGEYYAGNGLGANITIHLAPKAGFALTWYGCLGLYGHNYGSVIEKDGKIVLRCKLSNTPGAFGDLYTEYYPVRWGARRYLIPCERIVDFCNDINSGVEPRGGAHGEFLLAVGDDSFDVSGAPQIPAPFLKFLLPSPISAHIVKLLPTVTSVDEDGKATLHPSVTIDAGSDKGILPGVRLHIADANGIAGFMRVVKVRDSESDCVIDFYGGSNAMPDIGLGVSTERVE